MEQLQTSAHATPPEFLKVSHDDSWMPCPICGGELTQIRKARFTCLNCSSDIIGDEEDMRP